MAGLKLLAFFSVISVFIHLSQAVPAFKPGLKYHLNRDFREESEDSGCEDERPDCGDIIDEIGLDKLDDYCKKYKDDSKVKLCRKTCNMCKFPSPIGCEDERPDCGDIIDEIGLDKLDEYCEKYKDDSKVKLCRKTCNMCKAPSPIGCEDERDDCERIEEITGGGAKLEEYCKHWEKEPAIQQCRKTCKICPKAPSPTEEPQTEKPETEKPTKKITVAPKPTEGPEEGPTGFQKGCLDAHNDYRFFHGVPPLKWSVGLTRDAQSWANHLARTNKFEHDPTARGKDQGENLYYKILPMRLCERDEQANDCMGCREIVKMWYDEEKDYDYVTGKSKSHAPVLHFTQVIWKATKELGMATAVANNRLVAVARYSPVGNNYGQFQENVPEPDFP